ncbi:MAG: D-inositol-3-phosphate glycosyltransferase [Anaerolineales bacterium]|nr:D-inositol-3-phosphate glycosyltransferase [Anaerolineales bacterium]
MISSSFYPIIGGSENSIRRMSQYLVEHYALPIRVLTRRYNTGPGGILPARDTVDGVPVTRVWSPGETGFSIFAFFCFGLWHLLWNGRRGIYEAHDFKGSNWIAVFAKYLYRGKAVIRLRTGRYRYEILLRSGFTRWQILASLRLADRIIVVNDEMARYLSEMGFGTDKVVRITNAIETRLFTPNPGTDKTALRKKLGLPADKKIFLYTGRPKRIKGFDLLLQAWALLPGQIRDSSVLIAVGMREGEDPVNEFLGNGNEMKSIVLVGLQEDVREYYRAADVFVLASRTEGMSNSLLEAMASGLPALASNVGGAADLIEDGRNGYLFETGNPLHLSEKILALLDREADWQDMGKHARQAVIDQAEMELCAQKRRELYSQLALS